MSAPRPPRPHLHLSALFTALALAFLLAGCRRGEAPPPAVQVAPVPGPQVQQVQRALFYPSGQDQLLSGFRVPMPVSGNEQEDMEEVVRRLIAGPPGPGQTQAFLEHSDVRAVFLLGSEAVVDLTGPVRSGAGSDTEVARVYGVVQTLHANFPDVRSVRILVDGQEVESLLGHLDLRHSLVPEARLLTPAERASLGSPQ
jgi:germination protein M